MSVARSPARLESSLEQHARTHGQRTATIDAATGATTYAELDRRATRVSLLLQQVGVRRGDRVAIWLPKCTNTVAVILGTLRLGAAYVPIDSQAPPARVALLLEDCSASAIWTASDLVMTLPVGLTDSLSAVWLTLERVEAADALDRLPLTRTDPPTPASCMDADATAYILYTSGTTGIPKGVVVSQRAATAFVSWAIDTFAITREDCLASHAPLHFDLSILDVFAALHAGASVVLFDDAQARNPRELAAAIATHGITTWYSTPSALMALERFGQLDRHTTTSLTRVLFAGEVFPIRALRQLMTRWPQATFFNLFGPTETNVCLWYRVPAHVADPSCNWTALPIGAPSRHCETRITPIDDGHADASVGELEVSGEGVMTEYWQRPGETTRAFVSDAHGVRWYRTGDLVRRMPDGLMEFHGRRDRMVKRRGYRIELGELESVFAQFPLVSHAAAVVRSTETGLQIHVHCAVPEGTVTTAELRQFVSALLPVYMLPDRIAVTAALPMTSTGKIDYRALDGAAVTHTPRERPE